MTPGRGDAVEQSREARTRRGPTASGRAHCGRPSRRSRGSAAAAARRTGGCSPGSPLVRASLRRRQKEGDGGRECLQWRPLSGVSAPAPGARCPPSAEQWRLRPRSTQREAAGGGSGRGSRGLQWAGRRCHVGAGEAGRGGSRWRERAAEAVGGTFFGVCRRRAEHWGPVTLVRRLGGVHWRKPLRNGCWPGARRRGALNRFRGGALEEAWGPRRAGEAGERGVKS